jgi:hypothetical protein
MSSINSNNCSFEYLDHDNKQSNENLNKNQSFSLDKNRNAKMLKYIPKIYKFNKKEKTLSHSEKVFGDIYNKKKPIVFDNFSKIFHHNHLEKYFYFYLI